MTAITRSATTGAAPASSVVVAAHSMAPRFRAFVLATGIEPEPGQQVNAAFMRWVGDKWLTWCGANGIDRHAPKSPEQHDAFDAWLDSLVAATAG